MTDVHPHCTRPWWMRPPVWLLGIVLVTRRLGIVEIIGRPAATPYSTFLDQLDAGNVASITFRGTEIDGRFKRPLNVGISNGATQADTFRSRVPDFGDPSLIPELRKQHVAIDVISSSWSPGSAATMADGAFPRGDPHCRLGEARAGRESAIGVRDAHASNARNDRICIGFVREAKPSREWAQNMMAMERKVARAPQAVGQR